ncbi:MAG: Gfo/Idh/MocA family oxidoreductase [Elusimicrobiota bacterium]
MSKRKIRFGVVGAGRMGTHHARTLSKHPDIELVGVSDTNVWRAQVAAWRSGALAHKDYRDFLGKVDAVVVAVPTALHFEVGQAVLTAGAHCLIEKPLASSVEEAHKLLALAEENKVQLQVGHVERFNPAILQAIEHIRHPRFITVERLGPYDPRMQDIGVVLDLMIHDIDILLTLVNSEVESMEPLGATLLSRHEDIANVRIRFKSGCIADLTASRISLKRCRKIRIFQESSYISLDYLNASLQIYEKKKPEIRSLKDIRHIAPRMDKTQPLSNQINHFLDCIRNNRKPWPSGEHGLKALKLALQITEELKRYELSGFKTKTVLPKWDNPLEKIAQSIKRSVRGRRG